MNKTPRNNIYKVPEGYFETLPDRLIRKRKAKARTALIYRMVAAAVVAFGLVLFAVRLSFVTDVTFQAEIDQEVEFYINSGYWDAEDVIGFSDNPDELLDRIIAEEWSGYDLSDEQLPLDDLEY
jgi:hypothetical protein